MKRRHFLATTLAATAAGAIPAAAKSETRQFYEWIRIEAASNADKKDIEQYWDKAAIPALNRLGIKPVGVFRSKFGSHGLDYYVLIPHPSMESFLTTWDKVAADKTYQSNGEKFSKRSMADPLYYRFHTSLLHAFTHLPMLDIPEHVQDQKGRIYEVRIYESHSREKAKLKVEMFNEGGEIALFQETGLNPVMFGETLAGEKMPNLTYLLAFADMAEHDKAWDTFRTSDGWKNMKDLPRYAETVSSVTDIILSPCGCSQM